MPESIPFDIPMIDLCDETHRHVIIAQGTPESYKGHPTTLLMPDQKTMFCVYPLGHGGTFGGAPAQRRCRSDLVGSTARPGQLEDGYQLPGHIPICRTGRRGTAVCI